MHSGAIFLVKTSRDKRFFSTQLKAFVSSLPTWTAVASITLFYLTYSGSWHATRNILGHASLCKEIKLQAGKKAAKNMVAVYMPLKLIRTCTTWTCTAAWLLMTWARMAWTFPAWASVASIFTAWTWMTKLLYLGDYFSAAYQVDEKTPVCFYKLSLSVF